MRICMASIPYLAPRLARCRGVCRARCLYSGFLRGPPRKSLVSARRAGELRLPAAAARKAEKHFLSAALYVRRVCLSIQGAEKHPPSAAGAHVSPSQA